MIERERKKKINPLGYLFKIFVVLLKYTRRYGSLRGPTSSSCGGLWPRHFLPFGQKKSFLCSFGPFLAILVSRSNRVNIY